MTQPEIFALVQAQLAIDLNCSISDLNGEKNSLVFVDYKENQGRRPFPRSKQHFELLSQEHHARRAHSKRTKGAENDRQILRQLFLKFGFSEAQVPSLCVTFDKMDKIGINGIKRELSEKGFDPIACSCLLEYVRNEDFSMDECARIIGASDHTQNIENIIRVVNQISNSQYRCEFDISLVRGQGYYTGAVFEIESLAYSSSLAGGGRYDNLIGKFINERVPAVGFSIGFERIFDLLLEQNFIIPGDKKKIALFFENDYYSVFQLACNLRNEYNVSIFEKPQKLGKFLDKLQNDGYSGFCIAEQSPDITIFAQK